jgi:hypothetical protein
MIGWLIKTALVERLDMRNLNEGIKVLGLLLGVALLLHAESQRSGICTVANSAYNSVTTLAGTGGKSLDGPLLFDYTCPVAKGNDFVLPKIVILEVVRFPDSKSEKEFRALRPESLFQAVIEGFLECKDPFDLQKSDDGDIVRGSGYGPLGLYQCRLRDARLIFFHRIGATRVTLD